MISAIDSVCWHASLHDRRKIGSYKVEHESCTEHGTKQMLSATKMNIWTMYWVIGSSKLHGNKRLSIRESTWSPNSLHAIQGLIKLNTLFAELEDGWFISLSTMDEWFSLVLKSFFFPLSEYFWKGFQGPFSFIEFLMGICDASNSCTWCNGPVPLVFESLIVFVC